MIILLFAALVLFLAGCAVRMAVMKGYDFTAIKKVGVLSFQSPILEQSAGDAISDEFVRQLIPKNIMVVERQRIRDIIQETQFGVASPDSLKRLYEQLGVEVLITGTITRYIPDKKNTLFLESTGPNPTVRTQILTTNAEIGISARMIDVKTGMVVWSAAYSYESFSLDDAIYGAVSYLLGGMKHYWPQLKNG